MTHSHHDTLRRSTLPPWVHGLIGVAVVAVTVGLAWWLAKRGPGSGGGSDVERPASVADVSAEEMRAESLELEARFDEAVPEGTIATAEQLLVLEHALEAQRDYVRLLPNGGWEAQERLRDLEVRLATERGRGLLARSESLETEAAAMTARGERPEAITALQEALRLQREIHTSIASAEVRRPAREAVLLLQIETLEAEPLAASVEQLQNEARTAVAAGDMARAEASLREAARGQERINREFAGSRFSARARLDQIEAALASLGATDLVRTRDVTVAQALEMDTSGRSADAAILFGRARDLQERINTDFPRSEAADPNRPSDFETARQTAASRSGATEFEAALRALDAALAAGRIDEARPLIQRAATLDATLREGFPRSRLIDASRTERLAILQQAAPRLETLHAAVSSQLLPVPGMSVRMFANEVSQSLYQSVMGTSPSRAAGEHLPVESLSSAEAEDFCRRLSALLARPVRLPRQEEFAAVLAVSGAEAWDADHSGGAPRAVDAGAADASGFRDVRGNVAEWVIGGEAGERLVAGGSYADSGATIAATPFRASARSERYRTVGFRFVVE